MTKDLLVREGEIIKEMDKVSGASRQLLRENPIGYSVTRHRQLRAGLLNGDQKQVDVVTDDVAAAVGRANAERWKLSVWEKLVKQQLREAEKTS